MNFHESLSHPGTSTIIVRDCFSRKVNLTFDFWPSDNPGDPNISLSAISSTLLAELWWIRNGFLKYKPRFPAWSWIKLTKILAKFSFNEGFLRILLISPHFIVPSLIV